MVLLIRQETYDAVVKENIEELAMSPKDAIDDAIKQFEAQGVDLTNIIKDLALNDMPDVIITCLKKLTTTTKDKESIGNILRILEELKTELDKDIARRVYAGKHDAYSTLLDLMKSNQDDINILNPALKTIISLMTGHPDLLDEDGIKFQIQILDQQRDVSTIQLILRWIRECCIKHEINRQNIFNADIADRLRMILRKENATGPELKDACGVIRALVLDDDVRHEFGKAHEHASQMARQTLGIATGLLSKFKHDKSVVGDIMLTIATLVVRNEFCQDVEDAGGLTYILDVMINHPDIEKLNWQALKLLKALAGNDKVKAHIVTSGSAPLIVSVISRFKNSESVVAAGFSCITALTLKSSSNAGVFYDCGAAIIIIDAMKQFPKSDIVLRQACQAIRNMAVRNKAESREFIAHGIESMLNEALKIHGSDVQQEINAALRDLDCKVQLKERWLGKGVNIKHE